MDHTVFDALMINPSGVVRVLSFAPGIWWFPKKGIPPNHPFK
jgi:hypothetical protein